MKYAQFTKVPVSQSKAEIEHLLTKYKADQFGAASDFATGAALVQFRYNGSIIRFEVCLANLDEQQIRQSWRALVLAIKSKLESVESGIETFEEAFLAHVVMPNGATFGKVAIPQIQKALEDGRMPVDLLEWRG